MLRFLIHRPIGVLLLTASLVLVGSLLGSRIPLSILPDFSVPELVVELPMAEHDAYDIEANLLEPLRSEFGQLPGLVNLESYAVNGKGSLRLRYQWGTDMRYAYLQLNAQIDRVRHLLPPDAARPQVLRLGAGEIPMMQLALADSSQGLAALKEFARSILKRRFEQIPGIAQCALVGGREQVLHLEPYPTRLREAGLSIGDLEQAIASANFRLGSARFQDGQYAYDLELESLLQRPEDLGKLRLRVGENRLVPLSSLAQIKLDTRRPSSLSLYGGEEVILLEIFRRPEANLLSVAEAVRSVQAELQERFPQLSLSVVDDQSDFVAVTVQNLQQSVSYGICFAVMLLFFFLGSFRAPLIMAICVPVSLALTLLIFALLGLSFNLMTLAGLAIGVGVLIDNGIIVVESIARLQREGQALIPAILAGTQLVVMPLIAATCTTLSIFLPLVFAGEIVGVFFRDQALAIALALGSSLLVALCLLPLLYRITHVWTLRVPAWFRGRWKRLPRSAFSLRRFYHRAMLGLLKRPGLTWGLAVSLLVWGGLAFSDLPTTVFPAYQQSVKELHLDWSPEVGLSENRIRVERLLTELDLPKEASLAFVGAMYRKGEALPSGPNHAIIRFRSDQMAALQSQVVSQLKRTYPDLNWQWQDAPNVMSGLFPDQAYPVQLYVSAQTMRGLVPTQALQSLKAWLADREEVAEAVLPFAQNQLAYQLSLNTESMARHGLAEQVVVQALNQRFGRKVIGSLRSFDRQTDIMLVPVSEGSLAELLQQQRVGPQALPLARFVHWQPDQRYQCLYAGSEGLRQVIWLNPTRTDLSGFYADLKQWALAHQLNISWNSEHQSGKHLLSRLSLLLLISVALLYLVMAAQFESLRQPLIVILTIPFGLAGSLLLLWLSGASLNLMSGIGVIIVAGIVVNDAILKVDATNRYRKAGLSVQAALAKAGNTRFRPILLTSLTTILAVLPILFTDGLGYTLQAPLCLAVIGGIVLGTLASLFFIPLFYQLLGKSA